ncbi:hypothetical protein J2751_000949 [Halorubrum alkaliphilum]|uniref:Uncharacterized protein n=1 Tax=Halorubrum alkaliphilum TaxID=261290 RepID=A0A8T4GFI9_9EURY|nr:hypothetical protein [Halorubrum alkaliphilum]
MESNTAFVVLATYLIGLGVLSYLLNELVRRRRVDDE